MLNNVGHSNEVETNAPAMKVVNYHPSVEAFAEPVLIADYGRDVFSWYGKLTPSLPLGVSESSYFIENYLAAALAEYGSLTAKDWRDELLIDVERKARHLPEYESLIDELDTLKNELGKQVALTKAKWAAVNPNDNLIPWKQAKEELRFRTAD